MASLVATIDDRCKNRDMSQFRIESLLAPGRPRFCCDGSHAAAVNQPADDKAGRVLSGSNAQAITKAMGYSLVDDLLTVCRERGLQLDWRCRAETEH